MARFDGVLLIALAPTTPTTRRAGTHTAEAARGPTLAEQLVAGAGMLLRLPDGALCRAVRRPGVAPWFPAQVSFPPRLDPSARPLGPASANPSVDPLRPHVIAAPLRALAAVDVTAGDGDGARLVERIVPDPHATVRVVAPVPTSDLVARRPLDGGPVHAVHLDAARTCCGRFPAQGPRLSTARIDCRRCLAAEPLASRCAQQLAGHGALTDLVDPLTAGALARWWPRLEDCAPLPTRPVLDAAAGMFAHGLPGAPDQDALLHLLSTNVGAASDAVRRWARGEAMRRVRHHLAGLLPTHPRQLDRDTAALLELVRPLLGAGALADELVRGFARHGPAPALEPLAAEVARAAAAEGRTTDETDRFRRRHAVAAALTRELT
ncbi:MAG: hypothetical protein JJT89_18315 [Nitriliruptoraceae bacterium]|nr:hypothetical protein [Nitriliruptoraceae bacterium]